MFIHPEPHLDRLAPRFSGRNILEIGCGDGFRSAQIARRCKSLSGVDPDAKAVAEARRLHGRENRSFHVASATDLPFPDGSFDVAVFVLSLHHIPGNEMPRAIDEAVRVTAPGAEIIFIEPGFRGSFFEVDSRFGACDGDERLVKALALVAMLEHPCLSEIDEFWDETHYSLESTDDFLREFQPRRGTVAEVDAMLGSLGHKLWAERRINVFSRK